MKSYLSLIPISAKVHRRQNRMTRLCIIFSVFMVTAVFSMAEMGARMEQSRLLEKHGSLLSFQAIYESGMGQSLILTAMFLFLLKHHNSQLLYRLSSRRALLYPGLYK